MFKYCIYVDEFGEKAFASKEDFEDWFPEGKDEEGKEVPVAAIDNDISLEEISEFCGYDTILKVLRKNSINDLTCRNILLDLYDEYV